MGIVKAVLLIFAVPALIAAYGAGAIVERSRQPTYALQPEDCPRGATGWEIYQTYRYNKGEIITNIKYECK